MAKVEGSSPFIRFPGSPPRGAHCAGPRRCVSEFVRAGHGSAALGAAATAPPSRRQTSRQTPPIAIGGT
jgi:hypothetical protein